MTEVESVKYLDGLNDWTKLTSSKYMTDKSRNRRELHAGEIEYAKEVAGLRSKAEAAVMKCERLQEEVEEWEKKVNVAEIKHAKEITSLQNEALAVNVKFEGLQDVIDGLISDRIQVMMSMKHGEGFNGHRRSTLVDPSISINMQSPEKWIRGLSALPTNHPRIFGNTDLTELPCYDGTQVIVKLLNEVFLFCTSRMLNHQVLLSYLQGLLIFSEGMKIPVRQ